MTLIRKMNRKFPVILMLLMLVILSGCDQEDKKHAIDGLINRIKGLETVEKFDNEKEGVAYINEKLEEKYKVDFVVKKDTAYFKEWPLVNSITAEAYAVDTPDITFDVYANTSGKFEDGYGNNYFEQGAQADAEEFCAGRSYVDYCDSELVAGYTEENLLEKYDTYDEYRQDHSIYYNIHVKGRNPVDYPKDYVEPILEMQDDLLNGKYGDGYLVVDYGDINLWWWPYDKDDDNLNVYTDKKFILETIQGNIGMSQAVNESIESLQEEKASENN